MKNKIIISFCFIILGSILNAQIAIGKSTVDGLGILDFASGDSRGIVLPFTSSISSPTNGTFTFDTSSKKVKYYGNNSWIDMTFEGSLPPINTTDDEKTTGSGVIVGANSSTATGVLVLESNSMALILPKINNVSTDIFSPVSGTMCYDLTTNSIAIYNGNEWSFWK